MSIFQVYVVGVSILQVLVDMSIFRVQFSGHVDISGTSGYGDIPGAL